MKLSRHLGKTVKEVPNTAQVVSHQLMIRAGYIKQLSAGLYSYMPLMTRSLMKISQIIREEMDKAGAQELLMPAMQPSELWKESERWDRYTTVDGIMFSFKDRRGSTVCLGPTHEEVITDIVRKEVSSYKELPKNLYQIQSKFRDEIRPRFGLMRAREFVMKDAYSFDLNEEALDVSYKSMHKAYTNIFTRIGSDFRSVQADAGAIGGSGGSEEFMVLAKSGEDLIIYCDSCDYSANQERAESKLEVSESETDQKPMERVFGENIIGAQALADFLKIPISKTTKTILYQADEEVVAVLVRGDCEINEIKVANFLGCSQLTLASAETIKELTGAEVGYAGPVNLPDSVRIIADHYVNNRVNFECGANETNYHNVNVNFERDFKTPEFGDFKLSQSGEICTCCDGKLLEARGIEVGHIFKLGTIYTEKLKCEYLDKNGRTQPMHMGCYGIGVSRIASAVIEQNHDEGGIIWPINVAPYHVHLVGLNVDKEGVGSVCEEYYSKLSENGIEVIYDDRDARPGEKFNDADLMGIPVRITISPRTIKEDKVEYKLRKDSKESAEMLSIDEVITRVQQMLKA